MMCMQIEMFRVSVIDTNASMVVYGLLFGGLHPVNVKYPLQLTEKI